MDWIWTYRTQTLQPELQGWKKPIWFGSAGWHDDEDEVYWARTVAIRVPWKRYVIVKMPFKRKFEDVDYDYL